MRIAKILGLGLAAIVSLLLILLLAVWLLVNPNDYRARIAEAVQSATGRSLQLDGNIKLSVFPWIALEFGPASLGNPPGFGTEPFAAVTHAVLRVRLLPLLRKHLEIGRIDIDGLDLRLRRNASGQGNWQNLGSTSGTASSSSNGDALDDLAGLAITNSRISYQDTVLEHVNLTVGRFRSGASVPLTLKCDLGSGTGKAPIHIESHFDLTPDLRAQTLVIPQFSAQLAGARIQGSMSGKQILDAPSFTGSFDLAPLALRDSLAQLGIKAPVTRDARALGKLSARGDFAYGANALRISKLSLTLDDSQLTGAVAITNLDSMALLLDLAIDRIDVDRYLSPPSAGSQPASPAAADGSAKPLDAEGSFAIGAATIAGVKLTQIIVGLHARDGVSNFSPVHAQLYGGRSEGSISLDGRAKPALLSIDQSLKGIDVAQLLNDLAHTRRLSGRGNVTARLTARGLDAATLIRSLNGRIAAQLADGALQGVDIGFEIQRAQTLLKEKTLTSGGSSGQTRFDSFQASAQVSNGVASSTDINIATPQLRITGQGSSNLNNLAIDYRIKATLLKSALDASDSKLALAEVPVKITGTMTNPVVRPDLEGVAKARLQQEIDKHKDEIKDKLKDQLQNLFKH